MTLQVALLLLTFAVSAITTGLVRRHAIRQHWLDHPNERSSHIKATPRGGGLAIVITSLGGAIVLWMQQVIDRDLAIAFLGGGAAVGTVGFLDDRGSLAVSVRMMVHIVAAAWAVFWLGGLPPLSVGERVVDLGWPGHVLGVVGIVWTLNLFNFMDGIDGLAGAEATSMGLIGGGLALLMRQDAGMAALAICMGLAALGFLVWNWPPAKIFMGDVGSGYLGFVLAVLAIAHARTSPSALYVWLILGGVFFVDATVTLLRRWRRGERVYEAHRTHAYQWMAWRWNSHRRVTCAVIAINAIWLAPCAWLALRYPHLAGWIALAVVGVLALLAIGCGSGRPVETDR